MEFSAGDFGDALWVVVRFLKSLVDHMMLNIPSLDEAIPSHQT